MDQPVNLDAIRAEAGKAKAKEFAEMIALGQRTGNSELAQEFISNLVAWTNFVQHCLRRWA